MPVQLLAAIVFAGLWLLLAAIGALGWRAARTLDRGEGPWVHGL